MSSFAAARAERFHDAALMLASSMSTVSASIGLADARRRFALAAPPAACRHGQFVAFAAHVLEQDGQVQFAAARHAEHVGIGRVLDAQRDVALQFARAGGRGSGGW
jgi:hypothetical protein